MLSRGAIFYSLAPLLELWVAIQIGSALGAGVTVLALFALSVLGGYLLKARGVGAFNSALQSVSQGQKITGDDMAARGVALLGAVLLMLPGFVSGGIGLALQVPVLRKLLAPLLAHRVPTNGFSFVSFGQAFNPRGDVIDVDGDVKGDTNSTNRPELR
jgi:UPF0716 protein FxsA